MFWKKKPMLTDPQFGVLTYSDGEWTSGNLQTEAGEFCISIEGDPASPSPDALEYAYRAFKDSVNVVRTAAAFIEADAKAVEFKALGGALDVFGLSFRRTAGEFSVDFGLTDWPDAMLNVQFKDGIPVEVWLGD